MAQKGLWNITKKRMLEDRGALPKEDGDCVREYKAMHEDNFVGCWLREDTEGKATAGEEMKKGHRRKDKVWEKGGWGVEGKGFCG